MGAEGKGSRLGAAGVPGLAVLPSSLLAAPSRSISRLAKEREEELTGGKKSSCSCSSCPLAAAEGLQPWQGGRQAASSAGRSSGSMALT